MRKFLICVLLALALSAPAFAQEAGPPEKTEIPARSCYLKAQSYWNSVMATTPLDRKALQSAFVVFSGCARIAVLTGPMLKSGSRMVWDADYFADTLGALYAQEQLVRADARGRCLHLSLAADLAQQAQQTAGQHAGMGFSVEQFLDDWSAFVKAMRAESLGCGVHLHTV